MTNHDPRTRLLELAGQQRVSLAQLSGMIGRNATYLQQFVRKGSPRKLEETDRRTLARFLGVGEGELGAAEEFSRELGGSRREDWIDVPRLALGASAGPGVLASDEAAFGALRFSARWLRSQGLDPAMLSAIAVAGDSMEPVLRDGDEILVDRTPRAFREGVHVVRLDDVLMVKRLALAGPDALTLISENRAYPPRNAQLADVQVIGRVVWKCGRL